MLFFGQHLWLRGGELDQRGGVKDANMFPNRTGPLRDWFACFTNSSLSASLYLCRLPTPDAYLPLCV